MPTFKCPNKYIRPLLSLNCQESHTRVYGLYKAWCRMVPHIVRWFDIPKSESQVKCKIREYFYKNAGITDYRVVDMLVIKGYMELKEVTESWQQKGHVMAHWKPTLEPKPNTFLGKFLAGKD